MESASSSSKSRSGGAEFKFKLEDLLTKASSNNTSKMLHIFRWADAP